MTQAEVSRVPCGAILEHESAVRPRQKSSVSEMSVNEDAAVHEDEEQKVNALGRLEQLEQKAKMLELGVKEEVCARATINPHAMRNCRALMD